MGQSIEKRLKAIERDKMYKLKKESMRKIEDVRAWLTGGCAESKEVCKNILKATAICDASFMVIDVARQICADFGFKYTPVFEAAGRLINKQSASIDSAVADKGEQEEFSGMFAELSDGIAAMALEYAKERFPVLKSKEAYALFKHFRNDNSAAAEDMACYLASFAQRMAIEQAHIYKGVQGAIFSRFEAPYTTVRTEQCGAIIKMLGTVCDSIGHKYGDIDDAVAIISSKVITGIS